MRNKITICALLMVFAASTSWGQAPSVSAADNAVQNTSAPPATTTSEFRPPSGAQPFSLGLDGMKQLDINVFATQSWDSAAPGFSFTSTSEWKPATSFGGSLRLSLDRQTSLTSLSYNGRGIAYPNREPLWSSYHNLDFSHNVKLGRWGLSVIDSLAISPDSPFGGYGFGLPSGTDSLNQSLNPQYLPNQSIVTGFATSYANSVTGQIEYGLSRRASITASAGFGILRFTDSDFQNDNQITAAAGYNYNLTAKDSINLNYTFGKFNYLGVGGSFTSHTAQFGYAHRLNGRFSIQLAGGPQIINTSGIGGANQQIQASGNASLLYAKARTNFGLSYFTGTTGGSGVLVGSTTHSVQFDAGRELSKNWKTAVTFGYANNSGLVQHQEYNTLFVAPSLRHALTRNLGATFNYSYQRQLSGSSCVTLVCGELNRHFVSVGLEYAFRPIRLE